MSLEIRVLPIDQLVPAPYNPRRVLSPKSPAYRKLAASLKEFGLVEPLVWNELTGHVVGGHMRLRVLRELGTTEVPVSVVRLTDAREKEITRLQIKKRLSDLLKTQDLTAVYFTDFVLQ